MNRWLFVTVVCLAIAGCTTTASTTTVTPTILPISTAPATSTSTPTTITQSATVGEPCTSPGEPAAIVDVDGDGIEDAMYLDQRDDSGHNLVVCSDTLDTSLDIGAQNKPPSYEGTFDIDGDGIRELFYSAATGTGVIYFAATLVGEELAPVEYSWPVVFGVGDGEIPTTGTSFACSDDGIATLVFVPSGDLVEIQPTYDGLEGTLITETEVPPFTVEPDIALRFLGGHDSCFNAHAAQLEPVSLEMGVLYPSGLGVASGDGVMLFTQDAGDTWVDISPPQDLSWQQVLSVSFVDRYNGFAVLNDSARQAQLVATQDGGFSWQTLGEFPPLLHAGSQLVVDFVNQSDGWMYSFDPAATECPYLERTIDGGHTWVEMNHCLPDSGEIVFRSDGSGWLGGAPFFPSESGDSLYRTDDYGETWTEVRADLPEGRDPARIVYGLPAGDSGLLGVALYDGPTVDIGVYKTDVDGFPDRLLDVVSTDQVSDDIYPGAAGDPHIAFTDEQTWWIASHTGEGVTVSVTYDGGTTWSRPQEGPTGDVLALAATDYTTAWLTTTDGLFITRDGGESWNSHALARSRYLSPLPPPSNLSLTTTDAVTFTIEWDPILGAVEYAVLSQYGEWDRTTDTRYVAAPEVGGSYTITVAAVDALGRLSLASEAATVTPYEGS